MEQTKKCPICGKEKPLSEYPKNNHTRLGVSTYCKECTNGYLRKYRHKSISNDIPKINYPFLGKNVYGLKSNNAIIYGILKEIRIHDDMSTEYVIYNNKELFLCPAIYMSIKELQKNL